ncbi:hypothetical protein F0365_03910 [Nonlabens sp. Ci31]|uniref:hypothetical protein n=1 Tax=Nonlabens sp. Ci31 TaxID=2608253 RepID=UPI001462F07F|nr:hypothetical protein [Nonlabens sp. Ci31]QJP33611.1 hypothetical protein F0365_03910 [Nonlabens sp. Ci31]
MKTIYLLPIVLLFTACNSDDSVDPASLLPPITMTGENTFGCLIDGKFFRPRDGRSTINSDNKGLTTLRSEEDNWEIHAYDRKSNRTASLIIHIENLFENPDGDTGFYPIRQANGLRELDGPNHTYIYGRIWSEAFNSYQLYLSKDNSGSINITKLQRSPGEFSIHAGTFQAVLYNSQSETDSLIIDLGRFDLDSISLPSTPFN